ncbi:MAG: hypothetical protein HY078_10500 [Elusimicrobia bacterium]|nr:hypothetical protein [Elusimicrobiota bacterium]
MRFFFCAAAFCAAAGAAGALEFVESQVAGTAFAASRIGNASMILATASRERGPVTWVPSSGDDIRQARSQCENTSRSTGLPPGRAVGHPIVGYVTWAVPCRRMDEQGQVTYVIAGGVTLEEAKEKCQVRSSTYGFSPGIAVGHPIYVADTKTVVVCERPVR